MLGQFIFSQTGALYDCLDRHLFTVCWLQILWKRKSWDFCKIKLNLDWGRTFILYSFLFFGVNWINRAINNIIPNTRQNTKSWWCCGGIKFLVWPILCEINRWKLVVLNEAKKYLTFWNHLLFSYFGNCVQHFVSYLYMIVFVFVTSERSAIKL